MFNNPNGWQGQPHHNAYNPYSNMVNNTPQEDVPVDTSFIDESKWIPVGEQQPVTNPISTPSNPQYVVHNNNGTTTDVITGQAGVEKEAPSVKNASSSSELNDVIQNGDDYAIQEFDREFLSKLGNKDAEFDYGLLDESTAWQAPLVSLLTTGLTAALGSRAGMDERQVATMMADGIRRSGMDYKKNRDRIGRQSNIQALEAIGHTKAEIRKWLDTNDLDDLSRDTKNRPFVNSKTQMSNYYSKGEEMPNGDKASQDGTYTTFFTFNRSGVPQVAHITYDGNLEGKKLENDYAIEELKHGNKQREAQAEEAAEINSALRLSTETLQAVDQAIQTGDLAGGDHTGFIDKRTPTFFQDTQRADASF
ncbi:hypothetical protein BCU90_17375 [Vibrio lentus]|uniref:hypothetical protein n=1 Tax=Vibrio lentus TaxID=136468 RepID=UPI000C842217|nr:hypothetical protein [Vibrio lentus]PMG45635.1 hypothetical protein BCU90_17375 [Vibrio lentus]